VAVEVAPGVTVGGRLFPASPNAPLLVFFHGNGEIAADYDELAPLFTWLDVTLLVMDFRGYGRSGGQPGARTLLGDAVLAFKATGAVAREHGLEPTRQVVMGRSLGSAAAIQVACQVTENLDGLIIESGFADTGGLLTRMGVRMAGFDEARDGFDNLGKISRVNAPTLVIHGEEDRLVPVVDGRALYERCGAVRKRLLVVAEAGHNDLLAVGMSQYLGAIRDWMAAIV
jgi:hypothetical protein